MLTSLRTRLWLTYAILILLILTILGVGIFVYIIRNPLVDRQALARLDAAMTLIQRQLNDRLTLSPNRPQLFQRIGDSLEIRLLLFNDRGELELDSQPGSPVLTQPQDIKNMIPKGRVNDQNGKPWLYTSWTLDTGEVLMLAIPRQGGFQLLRSPLLRETLREDFMPAFLRTGVVALLIALIFAVWMGNWIAGPLYKIESAVRSLPGGKYQQIPVAGPAEVRTLAEAYNTMVEKVQSTQQSQRDFVANVSHELKTPLTSIQGFSGAILDGTVGDEPGLKKAAGIIKTEADRMHRLVVDLLDLARFDGGTANLDHQPVDLGDLLRRIGNQFLPQAADARIKLSLDIQQLPLCLGDADRLSQVFTNLVDNAIKHTPSGGFVKLTARAEDGSVLIRVIDSGEGIPAEHIPRIFERFYKVDGSRKEDTSPSTGLGLAIARQIIAAHGGEIMVHSIPGEGSAFEVVIPVPPAEETKAAQSQEGNLL